MTRKTYIHFIETLVAYYERRIPETKTLDLWYEAIKNIPDECAEWICTRIIKECEFFPRNIAVTAQEFYHEWSDRTRILRQINESYVPCAWCDSTGVISAYRKGATKNTRYEYVFRCGHCKQSQITGWPMATVQKLEQEGYTF